VRAALFLDTLMDGPGAENAASNGIQGDVCRLYASDMEKSINALLLSL